MIFIKKIILLVVLFFVFSVSAQETERMYKYYKLDRIYGDYVSSPSLEYPYLDNDDFIYSDYIDSSIYPSGENLEVMEINSYQYRRTKDISYINIQNNSRDITIDKIEVRYDGNLLDYECEELENGPYLLASGKDITLYLDKEYDQMRMTVRIVSDASYNLIYFVTGDSSSKQAIYRTEVGNDYTWNACEGTFYNYSKWVVDNYPNKLLNSRIADYLGESVSYKYRYKLYHSYNLIRNYYDDYLLEPFGDYIYRDDDDYRDFYFEDEGHEIINDIEKDDDYKDDNYVTKVVNTYNDKHFFEEKIYVPNTGV